MSVATVLYKRMSMGGEYIRSVLVYGVVVSVHAYTFIWVLNLVVYGSLNELL